ncbi:HAD-IB family hydrolase [Aromatoleum toluvorans]|uniref:HAD-IB family hydrolase n=1 Tax=Aromatoleum toluvorans TaxID=92002 RepID=A0ABX1Q0N5_9RHOO|nr:HAD-IB family hydrolase [Aromatoleum toluvorans]NMG44079.1 HAD-IB family hydrolase [Aromatoleum toluvorans]
MTPMAAPARAAAPRRVALFDLDLTLIPYDSGMAFLRFLVDRGVLEADVTERYLDACHRYVRGELPVARLHAIAMAPLARFAATERDALGAAFHAQIAATIPQAARALVAAHRERGDLCALVTATNDFVATPFAREFGLDQLLSSRAEVRDGRYTGGVEGELCHGAAKVARVERWLAENGLAWAGLAHSVFYSDSASDLPLLERVAEAVVVRPDPRLRAEAEKRGWRIVEVLADER